MSTPMQTGAYKQLRLLQEQALKLKTAFDQEWPIEKLHEVHGPYDAMWGILKVTLPQEVFKDSDIDRHSKWLNKRLHEGNPEACYHDITQLCGADIPNVIAAYLLYTWENEQRNKEAKISKFPWTTIHAVVRDVAQSRFDTKHYADAVESVFKEINAIVKAAYKSIATDAVEKDGADLMFRVFGRNKDNGGMPLLRLTDRELTTESGLNTQEGYMHLFVGAMRGIRNPKAHENVNIGPEEAWEMIVFASHLMRMWDRGQKSQRALGVASTSLVASKPS